VAPIRFGATPPPSALREQEIGTRIIQNQRFEIGGHHEEHSFHLETYADWCDDCLAEENVSV